MIQPDDILSFWFAGDPSVFRQVWFKKNPDFDSACSRFADALLAARNGVLDSWAEAPRGALALTILLDQMSRNLHRGSAEAFAGDARARSVARVAIARGFDQALTPTERIFLYLPFEHSEDLADQEESVRLFEALNPDIGNGATRAGHAHRDIIRRFGRFPHRNAALGRSSTPEELEYLAQPGAGF